MSSQESIKTLKRMPRGSIKLQFAGDLILARNDNPQWDGLFKRYEALFEAVANLEKHERILTYKLFNALMLTSYAKKAERSQEKHELFDLKNNIFISLGQNPDLRRYLSLKYLESNNFRVSEYCPACTAKNSENQLKRHEWKHCKNCKVDRDFYNVVAMTHKFNPGYVRIFLSNDLIAKLSFNKSKFNTGKLSEFKEEGMCGKFHYNARNLDAISFPSVREMYERFINK